MRSKNRYLYLTLCILLGLSACDGIGDDDFEEGSFTATLSEPVNGALEGRASVMEVPSPDRESTDKWIAVRLRAESPDPLQEIFLVYGGRTLKEGSFPVHKDATEAAFHAAYLDSTYLEPDVEISVIFQAGSITIHERSGGRIEGMFDLSGVDLRRFGTFLEPERVQETLDEPLHATGTFTLPR